MRQHRLKPIDYEVIDMLKDSNLPWSYKLGSVWELDEPQINKIRTTIDAYKKLEKLKDSLESELVQYKLRFGEI